MSEKYNFNVTISASDSVTDRATAAELLQFLVSDANQRHDHINHVTVHYSEMDGAEKGRLLDLLHRPTDSDIDRAILSIEALEKE